MKWLVVVLLVAVMVQAGSAAFTTTIVGNPSFGYAPLRVELKGHCYGAPFCGLSYNWTYNTSNQIRWSDDLANLTKFQAIISADNTTAPDGTMTAERLTANGSGSAGYAIFVPENNRNYPNHTPYTFSIYVKGGSRLNASIKYYWQPYTWLAAYSVVSGPGDLVYNPTWGYWWINNLSTTQWTRISGATTTTNQIESGWMNVTICPRNCHWNENGDYIYIWGAQFELGATASEYWPTNGTVEQPEKRNLSTDALPNITFTVPGRYTIRLNETGYNGTGPVNWNISYPYYIDVINSSTCNGTGIIIPCSVSGLTGSIARPPPTPVDVPIIIAGVAVGIFIARNRKET